MMLSRLVHLWKIPRFDELSGPTAGRRWLQIALLCWWIVLVATCTKSLLKNGTNDPKSVYSVFPESARRWANSDSLYAKYNGYDIYRYSPTFAVAALPLAPLSNPVGGVIWSILSFTALLAATRAFSDWAFDSSKFPEREGQILLLSLVPTIGGLWSQQSNAFIVAAILGGMMMAQQRKFWTAALLLAIPIYLKIWPVIMVLLIVLRWPKQLIGRGVVMMLALALLPYLFQHPRYVTQQYIDWYTVLTGPLQGRWQGYRDFWTIIEELRLPISVSGYKYLQVASLAGLFAYGIVANLKLHSDRAFLIATFSVWCCWQLLMGPGTERLTYGLIGPSAAFAVWESRRLGRSFIYVSILWWMISLFSMGSIELAFHPIFPLEKVLLPGALFSLTVWLTLFPYEPAKKPAALAIPKLSQVV
ncbi:MAG: glycosyltransferase family 87 protein [Pirellulales bacterium]